MTWGESWRESALGFEPGPADATRSGATGGEATSSLCDDGPVGVSRRRRRIIPLSPPVIKKAPLWGLFNGLGRGLEREASGFDAIPDPLKNRKRGGPFAADAMRSGTEAFGSMRSRIIKKGLKQAT